MQLSQSEENILREYQTKQYYLDQKQQGRDLTDSLGGSLEASGVKIQRQLQAQTLSTISQRTCSNKPTYSDRRMLCYGSNQRADQGQVKCVFELHHDDFQEQVPYQQGQETIFNGNSFNIGSCDIKKQQSIVGKASSIFISNNNFPLKNSFIEEQQSRYLLPNMGQTAYQNEEKQSTIKYDSFSKTKTAASIKYTEESTLGQSIKLGQTIPIRYSDFLDKQIDQTTLSTNFYNRNNFKSVISGNFDQSETQTQASINTRNSSQVQQRKQNQQRINTSNTGSQQSSINESFKQKTKQERNNQIEIVPKTKMSENRFIQQEEDYQQLTQPKFETSNILKEQVHQQKIIDQQKEKIHHTYFKKNMPLSEEEENQFYLKTSDKKNKSSTEEYTKQVIYPSSGKENRYNVNEQEQECRQELKTFESRSSSAFGDHKQESPSLRERQEDKTRQYFSFQKNESAVIKRGIQILSQKKSDSTLQKPTIQTQSSQQFSQRIQLPQNASVSQQSQITNKTQRILFDGQTLPKNSIRNNQSNLQIKLDVGTQVSNRQSTQSLLKQEQRNETQEENQKHNLGSISPSQRIQGAVYELSDVSVSSKNCQSRQSASVTDCYANQNKQTGSRLKQRKEEQCNKHSASVSINSAYQDQINQSKIKDTQSSQGSHLINQQKQERHTQSNSNRSFSNTQQDMIQDKILRDQQKEQNIQYPNKELQLIKKETEHCANNLFYNPYLQQNISFLRNNQLSQNQAHRNTSCYSTDRFEYKDCLKPKIMPIQSKKKGQSKKRQLSFTQHNEMNESQITKKSNKSLTPNRKKICNKSLQAKPTDSQQSLKFHLS